MRMTSGAFQHYTVVQCIHCDRNFSIAGRMKECVICGHDTLLQKREVKQRVTLLWIPVQHQHFR